MQGEILFITQMIPSRMVIYFLLHANKILSTIYTSVVRTLFVSRDLALHFEGHNLGLTQKRGHGQMAGGSSSSSRELHVCSRLTDGEKWQWQLAGPSTSLRQTRAALPVKKQYQLLPYTINTFKKLQKNNFPVCLYCMHGRMHVLFSLFSYAGNWQRRNKTDRHQGLKGPLQSITVTSCITQVVSPSSPNF